MGGLEILQVLFHLQKGRRCSCVETVDGRLEDVTYKEFSHRISLFTGVVLTNLDGITPGRAIVAVV